MADEKHLIKIKQGAQVWNNWRKINSAIKPDLSGAFLFKTDLSRMDLSEVNFTKADLRGADLTRANLNGAILIGASLVEANPIEADLREANLKEARLTRASLIGANLSSANLSGADFSDSNLIGANLSRANLYGTILNGADLSGANLDYANLRKAQIDNRTSLEEKWRIVSEIVTQGAFGRNLEQLDLSRTYLVRVNFKEANLVGVNFEEADLVGADMCKAKLSRANLSRVDLRVARLIEIDLVGADLSGSNLSRVCLSRGNLSRANLSKANLSRACLTRANFSRADLSDADLYGADMDTADFSKTDFSRANLVGTIALNTKFFGANFTAACLENWQINSQTGLEGVICDYVYLKGNQQERFPQDREQQFAPGEFTQLFRKAIKTLELVFEDGIDWKAFLMAHHKLQVEKGVKEIFVKSIEKRTGGNLAIGLEISSEEGIEELEEYLLYEYKVNLEIIEGKYRSLLDAKEEELAIYRKQNTDLLGIIKLQANQPIQNIIDIDCLNGNSSSANNKNYRSIEQILNGNERCTKAIAPQVKEITPSLASARPRIEELLREFSETIASEPNLDKEDKLLVTEQLKALAQAGENPSDEDMKKQAKKAIVLLKGTIAGFPRTTAEAPKCDRLLLPIMEYFGFCQIN